MPTTFPVLTQTWVLVSSEQGKPINIQPKTKNCQWVAAASLPTQANKGNTLNPEDFRTITLQNSDNLYARAVTGTTILGVTI